MYKFLLLLLSLGFVVGQMQAQNHPIKWTFKAEKASKGQYKIVAVAKIDNGWAMYSQFLDSDQGPVATSFEFALQAEQALVGKTEEKGDKLTGYDDMFAMNVSKYKKEVKFTQIVKAKKGQKIKGSVTAMCCNDAMCLPPKTEDFELLIK